jgi:hypothetical protein
MELFFGEILYIANIFLKFKKIITTITISGMRDSCREWFKSYQTLLLASQ